MRPAIFLTIPFVFAIPSCNCGKPAAFPPLPQELPVEPGEVLVVDLKPQTRTTLEASMKTGIVFVKYDRQNQTAGLTILDCQVDGTYGFIATTKRERTIKLDSGNDTAANLPFSALAINAKLGAEFFWKNTLDIAVEMVGLRKTTLSGVSRDMLPHQGDCADATHFVKSTTIGAFAVATTAKDESKMNAEIWLLAASHENHNSTDLADKDGDTGACNRARASDAEPIDGCGAPVFAKLEKISDAGNGAAPAPAPATMAVQLDDASCSQGFVRLMVKDTGGAYRQGSCSSDASKTHICATGDLTDCSKQCNDYGEPESCGRLGFMWQYGVHVAASIETAAPLYEKGCSGGAQSACAGVGVIAYGKKDYATALARFQTACDAGNARGCQTLGTLYQNGEGVATDPKRAFDLFARACSGGDPNGCFDEGWTYVKDAVASSAQLAAPLFRQACDGGVAEGCGMLGQFLVKGAIGSAPDQTRGLVLLDRACHGGHQAACAMAVDVRAAVDPGAAPTPAAAPASAAPR